MTDDFKLSMALTGLWFVAALAVGGYLALTTLRGNLVHESPRIRDQPDRVRPYGTSMEMLARSVPGVGDIVAQKSLLRIQDWRPIGKSWLGISGSSAAVKSSP